MDNDMTVGLEEEFFLCDLETLDCIERVPAGFRPALHQRLGSRAGPEILESMIELATGVHTSVPGAVAELKELRQALVETAERYDMAVMACGTHPFADWREQRRVARPRYEAVAEALGTLSNRIHICGLHVHVGIGSPDARVDLMNRVQHLLPLVLAASVSSPFWRGRPTGLAGYRQAIADEIPRSGLPGFFTNARELDTLMAKLTDGGLVADRSYVWWAIRPSVRYPTLEMRIADACPIIEDVGAIAAFYQASLQYLLRNPMEFLAWRSHYLHVLDENRWQAARHGLDGRIIEAMTGTPWTIREAIETWVARLSPAASDLGCAGELDHMHTILERGSASSMLTRLHDAEIEAGSEPEDAMRRVAEAVVWWTRGDETPPPLPLALVAGPGERLARAN